MGVKWQRRFLGRWRGRRALTFSGGQQIGVAACANPLTPCACRRRKCADERTPTNRFFPHARAEAAVCQDQVGRGGAAGWELQEGEEAAAKGSGGGGGCSSRWAPPGCGSAPWTAVLSPRLLLLLPAKAADACLPGSTHTGQRGAGELAGPCACVMPACLAPAPPGDW